MLEVTFHEKTGKYKNKITHHLKPGSSPTSVRVDGSIQQEILAHLVGHNKYFPIDAEGKT